MPYEKRVTRVEKLDGQGQTIETVIETTETWYDSGVNAASATAVDLAQAPQAPAEQETA